MLDLFLFVIFIRRKVIHTLIKLKCRTIIYLTFDTIKMIDLIKCT